MTLLKNCLALLVPCVLVACLSGCNPHRKVEHVFIISFDQTSPSDVAASDMPLFKKMASEGSRATEAYTIVPSLTLPSHVSMLTGVGPQKHQVIWNTYQPEKGGLPIPTVFRVARDHEQSTAAFVAKEKLQTLNSDNGVDPFVLVDEATAEKVALAFAERLPQLKPNLCFIHFADPDTTGHQFGVNSPEKRLALADCDRALGIIMRAIEKNGLTQDSVVILTSDHGGHDRSPEENASREAAGLSYQPGTHGSAHSDDVLIPWIIWGKGVHPGGQLKKQVLTYDTAATALWLLGIPLPEFYWGHPVEEAFE